MPTALIVIECCKMTAQHGGLAKVGSVESKCQYSVGKCSLHAAILHNSGIALGDLTHIGCTAFVSHGGCMQLY